MRPGCSAETTVSVGNDEQALSCVWSTKGACRNNLPFRIVPERGQVAEYNVNPPVKES